VTLIAGLALAFEQHLLVSMQFDRSMIAEGEYWRLFTGNLFHTNGWHLLFNIAGLLMLTQIFGRDLKPLHFVVFSIVNAALVGLSLYLFSPNIHLYVGLSGYLHGLFVLGCLIEIANGRRSSYLLLAGITAKITWENFYGSSEQMASLIDANVATDAHLYGALAAVPWFVLYWLTSKINAAK